jgi:hypothetical protein
MEFRVGDILAKCPGCGGTDFKPPETEHSGPHMGYFCASCGSATIYAKLITQIGRETLRRKKERLSGEPQKQTDSLPSFLRRNA